ncbi:MAG TPA: phosphoribosyltransferase family protein [Bacteriovoracaceae bacterium]|nr:phosphoribosyltransferase family protein [Bacteriovoracaceae bacterium]
MYLYQDRQDAGSELAQMIISADIKDPLMFAIPRGGVPVASVISHELGIPFDVLVTREVGYPGMGRVSIGAMAEDERPVITNDINFADPRILQVINEEKTELRRRIAFYRQGQDLPEFTDRNVILVDDGLTDGISAIAAAKFLKEKGARSVFLAVPVAPNQDPDIIKRYIDEVICPHRVEKVSSVGKWFQDFGEVTDLQVLELLGRTPEPQKPLTSSWMI